MFKPKHVYIEKEALEYKLGKDLKKQFETMEIPVDILESNRVNFLRGKNDQKKYEIGKRLTSRSAFPLFIPRSIHCVVVCYTLVDFL